MTAESYCNKCGEVTKTNHEQYPGQYVAHVCVQCGADKRDCGSAPV